MEKKDNLQTRNPDTVTISRAEYEEFQAQRKKISELESRVDMLMEALRLARHKQFGASSEKSEDTLVEQLSFLFNEAEVFAETKAEEDSAVVIAAHKRHKKHEYALDTIPEGIPTEQVEHRLEGEALVCPQCGDTMVEIGNEVVRTLEIIPAQYIVREDIYYTYACKSCSEHADEGCETPIVKAPKEKNIIPGSYATPEAIAQIMTQKFVTLYRQEQELNRQGIQLSRQTMSNWILRATEDYLAPVYQRLHEELLKREVLHADGYAGYHSLPEEITVVGCWAHLRRKFDEAVKSLPKGKAKGSSAAQGLAYCNLLFTIEQEFSEKKVTEKERYHERLKQAKPVLDAMFTWANSRTAAPKSALGKALNYLKEQWPYLTNYLKDGRLEISNNRAERSIKPFVIDRKNFLFANTPKGATGSAVMFSMIQTAIENGLDPYRYLTWLLKTANNADLNDRQTVQALLPWNASIECRSSASK